jgi:chemotaxis protein CheD
MNHILLPGKADLKHFDASARWGINAMELLINRIMTLGGNRARLVAKVFGGAHILPSISIENGVGRKNVEFVMEFLETEAIEVLSHDLGGHESRKIYFHTDTGDVLLRRTFSRYHPDIALEERKVLKRLRKEAEMPADVTLF